MMKLLSHLVPFGVPENVRVSPAGNNMVRVSWTPTADTFSYMVMYEGGLQGEQVERKSTSVSGGDAREAILEGLRVDVEYSITVQPFGDLPGMASSEVTITLQGEGA